MRSKAHISICLVGLQSNLFPFGTIGGCLCHFLTIDGIKLRWMAVNRSSLGVMGSHYKPGGRSLSARRVQSYSLQIMRVGIFSVTESSAGGNGRV